MGFLHREGGIGRDTSHNALKWVPSMYNSFDHFPNHKSAHYHVCLSSSLKYTSHNLA